MCDIRVSSPFDLMCFELVAAIGDRNLYEPGCPTEQVLDPLERLADI
jgi:hypothetical protein